MKNKGFLGFLYGTAFGRILLKPLVSPSLSKFIGAFLDTRASKIFIPSFIKRAKINLEDYIEKDFKSFNACFSRKIKPELRPVADVGLVSPADGYLSAFPINKNSEFKVKNSIYTLSSLLGGDKKSDEFLGGTAVIIRLAVENYHRYIYIDNGSKGDNRFIPGKLHTVRPVALASVPVFAENCREYTFLNTAHFSEVAQIEVGAMLVGKIKNHHGKHEFTRGEEKGTFLYGGSTIILLFKKGAVTLSDKYSEEETPVLLGEKIGE